MKIVVFDLETKKLADEVGGWKNIEKMCVSCIGAWRSDTAMYKVWKEEGIKDFISWLNWADAIVGYNHTLFDYRVLKPYTNIDVMKKKENIDLLKIARKAIGKQVKLDTLAFETIGIGKTAGFTGAMAPQLYKEGRWLELIQYQLDDVQVTTKLFYHILKNKTLIYDGVTYPVEDLGINLLGSEREQLELF